MSAELRRLHEMPTEVLFFLMLLLHLIRERRKAWPRFPIVFHQPKFYDSTVATSDLGMPLLPVAEEYKSLDWTAPLRKTRKLRIVHLYQEMQRNPFNPKEQKPPFLIWNLSLSTDHNRLHFPKYSTKNESSSQPHSKRSYFHKDVWLGGGVDVVRHYHAAPHCRVSNL